MSKRRYSVTYIVHATTTVDVIAEDLEQAKEIAEGQVHVRICHQCSDILEVGDVGEMIQIVDDDAGEVVWDVDEAAQAGEGGEV